MPAAPSLDIAGGYRQQRKNLSKFGLWATAIYFIGLVVLVLCKGPSELWKLPFNAIGDFLAGAFAPLAFLWLVIGYRQQNIELSLNTDTLVSQVDEMKQSVQQQTKQAFSLAASERNAKRDLIAKLAELYLGRLSSFASVVCTALSVPGDWLTTGWHFYGNGDREFFFRLILVRRMEMDGSEDGVVNAIYKGMKDRRDTAHAAVSYVTEYRTFVSQITELDVDRVFVHAFDKGNVGKAYRLIEKAVQRFEDGGPKSND